jgi:hypothetical protein
VCGGDEENGCAFSEYSLWHKAESLCTGCAHWQDRIDSRLNMLCVKRTVSTTITWEKL